MSNPYIGEIRMFGGSFSPAGWAFCNGALMPISENDALFTLIGTTYGGDGQETFGLPDLQGRTPVHVGSGFQLGEKGGVESVTLTANQTPTHNHGILASNDVGNSPNATNNVIARSGQVNAFINGTPTIAMNAGFLGTAGGSQPHDNLQPYLCVSYIISLFGIFPQQN